MSALDGRRFLVSGVVLGQPMGGVRRHNQELLPRLARRLEAEGASLAVLEGATPIPFELPEIVERLASDVPAGPPLKRAVAEGPAIRRAVETARDEGRPFSLVHFGHLPVPKRVDRPFTLTLHDLRDLRREHTPFSRRLVARHVIGDAVRRAACTLSPSQAVREEVQRVAEVPPERTALVPNAADHFEPLPRRVSADSRLLHVGHLEPRKNLELLLRALALDPDLPGLFLAGAAKPGEEERLRGLARELGVLDRVEFHGPFADGELPRLYAEAACVVLPSREEGFGIPALEALRADCPLAIAELPALREVAGPEVPGFATDDAEACARAIRRALESEPPTLVRESWDEAAERWLACWSELLERGSG